MATLKTIETNRSVDNVLQNIGNASKKEDSIRLLNLIKDITNKEPKVWGNAQVPDFLIGFGKYAYQRKGSKETYEWFNIGFAPRKNRITIYLTMDISQEEELLQKLGKCKWGKGCLYINKLKDINTSILIELIAKSKDAKWH